jgi:fermentation-respiration switch protein FrsA (DUF1100 family)
LDLLIRLLVVVAVVAVALVAYLYLTQRSLIYFPGSTAPSDALRPAGSRSVELHTRDGLVLSAWFVPAAGVRARGEPGPAVLILNGNAGDRSHRLPLALALAKNGYAVLLFDYRGFAGNPGRPTEDGLRSDALAAVDALAVQPEVDPQRTVYFGESLGAAVAGGLATERAPAALILRSPPPSMTEMGRHHYPSLPVIDALVMDRYPLAEQVRQLRTPLLVLVAEDDEVVPPSLSRRVFEAALEPKRWVTLAAHGHNDPELLAGNELLAEVTRFLNERLPAGP